MPQSWMYHFNTAENWATFLVNICVDCQRTWIPELVPDEHHLCSLTSWGAKYISDHIDEGHPPESDLDYWIPPGCGAFLQK